MRMYYINRDKCISMDFHILRRSLKSTGIFIITNLVSMATGFSLTTSGILVLFVEYAIKE